MEAEMELALSLGVGGWILIIIAALVFGVAAQFVGSSKSDYEWIADAVAFAIGAVVASEFIVASTTFEPVLDGLAIVPALVGGLVVGIVVAVAARFMTGGTYAGRPSAV
jgi:uncharacterized membrane protein YeaQ/YmgE (transglycosylase-associated protein family)